MSPLASVASIAFFASLASVASAQTRWSIGHSYSSIGALRQPATMTGIKVNGGPWLSKIDAGVLARLPTGGGPALELGMRASTGSSRSRAERVYGVIARTNWSFPRPAIGLALQAEYEADGGLDVKRASAGAEITPLGWAAAGLGRFTGGNATGFRWRPWLGAAIVSEDGFRGQARIEALLRVPMSSWTIEGGIEATSWYLNGGVNGTSWLDASLSLELRPQGPTLTLSAEEGRRPPRFVRTSRAAVGVGFRL